MPWSGAARGSPTIANPHLTTGAANRAAGTDSELAARAQAGDRTAFAVLVDRYAPAVRRIARAVLHDADDADDAAQDAFLSALVKLQQYDPRRPFAPWLMRIVVNAATDRRRRRAVRRSEPLAGYIPATGTLPDADADRRALGERLRQALAALPERRRLAVVLFDVDGYTQAEIGHILGVPEGTVRSEVFHARRALRVLLADWKERQEE
jgi:RNA polymerase sigma-70 factor (ECF subfamily)